MPQPGRVEQPKSSRNQRLFANIQSTLNGGKVTIQKSRTERCRQNVNDKAEELNDLDSIISQIMDLNIRADRSALQIKRNISTCGFFGQMNEYDWNVMCKSLISIALTDGEMDFVVDLFTPLMEYDIFCEVMCVELMTLCSAFVMDGPSGIGNIPALLSAILCANWPRHLSKAIDTINPILYTSISVIKGWLLVLEEDNEAVMKVENSSGEVQEENHLRFTEQERESPEIVNRCAHSVCLLCESAQRSLWMKWPELCDEIYATIKPCITHNQIITGYFTYFLFPFAAYLVHIFARGESWTSSYNHDVECMDKDEGDYYEKCANTDNSSTESLSGY
ncbi:hypothetical protein DICVIV_00755 [Dictyocaulus viviparus]|uniref:DUF7627 domain-containing protein n=1 Tax=Dictyocaulus viviparus TaxID=29172 RepID=A0A0D8Y8L4_DICVI|nr:hypothetical protein DICVIV_00755 [Dictyocaulus viviparus]